MILTSIIIPCYNVAQFIEECLDSVYNQTYKAIEVICIDNNSSDDTFVELAKLKIKYPSLIIDKELKPGANAARNKGLEIANGEWIQFLDADDLIDKRKIEHQIDLIKNNRDSNIHFIAASFIKRSIDNKEIIFDDIEPNNYLGTFISKSGITSANLWNKNAVNKAGKWNESLKSSQETDLMFRLILNDSFYLVDTIALTIIRERESGQISQRNPFEKWKQYIDIRLSYLEALKKKSPKEYNLHKGIFYDFLMVSVLTLAKHSHKDAINYYTNDIKPNWKSSYSFGFTKLKVTIIKLFGFNFYLKVIHK